MWNDPNRARIFDDKPEIASGIPWLISNWMNKILGKTFKAYSYRTKDIDLQDYL